MRTSGSAGCTDGRADELVDGGDAECGVDLGVELLAQRALDARAQLGERVELARRARELVVELGSTFSWISRTATSTSSSSRR